MRDFARTTSRFIVIMAIATVGAWVAVTIGTPLPWMLGPLVATAIVAMTKMRVFDEIPVVPTKLRNVFVPIIGLMIGARISPETFTQLAQWWPSLLLVVPFGLLTQLVCFGILKRYGNYDKPTAFFASSPGGVVESVIISERFDGNPSLTAVQHLARISLAVTIIPLLLSLYVGHTVGSASGASMAMVDNVLAIEDILMLAIGAVAGVYVARKLQLPAANMLGALVVSAALHSSGLTAAEIPDPLVHLTQLVIGASLGGRFALVDFRTLSKGALLSLPLMVISLSVAALAGLTISLLGFNEWAVGFISFAPGGVTEMSLVAISIDADPVYVACHHIVRIFTAVIFFPLVYRYFVTKWFAD